MSCLGVEHASAAEDDEVDLVAGFGESASEGEGLLLGASVAEVVLQQGDVEWLGVNGDGEIWRRRGPEQGFVSGFCARVQPFGWASV